MICVKKAPKEKKLPEPQIHLRTFCQVRGVHTRTEQALKSTMCVTDFDPFSPERQGSSAKASKPLQAERL